jgi:hypothetical protein
MVESPLVRRPNVLSLALLLTLLCLPSYAVAQDGHDVQSDAKALTSGSALDAPPGWEHLATAPITTLGRYSHSPVEVLDLRDLQALERLVHAIATAP